MKQAKKQQQPRKQIRIFSFGKRWPDAQPAAPDDQTLQYIFDVRATMEDPAKKFGLRDGNDPEVRAFILSQRYVRAFLALVKSLFYHFISDAARDPAIERVDIYIRCRGGFQRSVAIASALAEQLPENSVLIPSAKWAKAEITVTHLTLERTRAALGVAATKK